MEKLLSPCLSYQIFSHVKKMLKWHTGAVLGGGRPSIFIIYFYMFLYIFFVHCSAIVESLSEKGRPNFILANNKAKLYIMMSSA